MNGNKINTFMPSSTCTFTHSLNGISKTNVCFFRHLDFIFHVFTLYVHVCVVCTITRNSQIHCGETESVNNIKSLTKQVYISLVT